MDIVPRCYRCGSPLEPSELSLDTGRCRFCEGNQTVLVALAELTKLRRDARIDQLVRRRMVSGNGIPVSRAYVTAQEVHDIDAEGGGNG